MDSAVGSSASFLADLGPFQLASIRDSREISEGVHDWLEREAIPPGFIATRGEASTVEGALDFVRASRVTEEGGILVRLFRGRLQRLQEVLYTKRRRDEESQPELCYRHRFTSDTVFTWPDDVEDVVRLAEEFGFRDARRIASERTLLDHRGASVRSVDIVWTDRGLRSICDRAGELDRVFGEVYRDWDQPGAGRSEFAGVAAPWLATHHPAYSTLMEILEEGANPLTLNYDRYGWLTGRNLFLDAPAYRELRALKQHVAALTTADKSEWPKILVDIDEMDDLTWRSLIALSRLAGREHTLINEISIHADGRSGLVLEDPHRLEDLEPRDPITEASGLRPEHARKLGHRERALRSS